VHVICSDRICRIPGYSKKSRAREVGVKKLNGLTVHRLPSIVEPWGDMIYIRGLSAKLKAIQPDVIHGHTLTQPPSLLAAYAAEGLGVKYFIDNHEYLFPGHPLRPFKKNLKTRISRLEYLYVRNRLAQRAIRQAKKVIAIAEITQDYLISHYQVPREKIFLSYLGAETSEFFVDPKTKGRARAALGIEESETVILFTGIISARKSMHLYPQILKKLKMKKWKFLMVAKGDEVQTQALLNLFEEAGLKNKVILVKNADRKEMPNYYNASDIALWLANNSVAILDAMACGLPVVVPRGQFAYAIDGNGLVFDPNQYSQVPAFLDELIENKEKRLAMSACSLKRVQTHFNNRILADKLVSLYQRS